VIVVHGVGSQERGETLATFMQTLGRVMTGESGTEILNRADVLVKSPPDPPKSLPDPTDEGIYFPHAVLLVAGSAGDPRHFYEFYWADESRVGDSVWNQARSYWQILVGLPRLGLYAFDPPEDFQPGWAAWFVDVLVRLLYVAAWSALVARLVVVLLIAVCRLTGYAEGRAALFYSLAWADLVRTRADLVFLLALAVWRLVSPRCGGRECPAVLRTALIALTAATLLTDIAALGVIYKPLDILKRLLLYLTSGTMAPPDPYDPDTYDPGAFYVFNTVTGFLWMMAYVLVLLWAAWAVARVVAPWLWRRLTGTTRRDDGSVDRVTARTAHWWGLIGFVLLFLHPLAFQCDWWLGAPKPDYWTLISFHPKPVYPVDFAENRVFRVYETVFGLTIGPFALVSFLLLTSSSVREAFVPGLELALDVLNYLPPRPFIADFHGRKNNQSSDECRGQW
jgi:hypothetical protein